MKPKKVFITGATGFIGQQLAFRLAKDGHDVTTLVRSEKSKEDLHHKNISFVEGDLFNLRALEQGTTNAEEVYHLAAFAQVWAPDNSFEEINVDGTMNVMKAAKQNKVSKFLLVSTAGAIGPAADGPATEETERQVDFFNDYERTKARAEQEVLESLNEHLKVVITNLTRVFGPGKRSVSNAVTLMIEQYARGKWHIMPGDGKSTGNYVFIDDAVNGLILALEKGKSGERYLIGGENASYEEFFGTLDDCLGFKQRLIKIPYGIMLLVAQVQLFLANTFGLTPKFTPGWVRKFLYDWRVSSRKAETELGYKYCSLKAGITDTLAWLNS